MPQHVDEPMDRSVSMAALQHIQSMLRRRERWLQVEIATLLAVGSCACLIGPIVLASIYWLLALLWLRSFFYIHYTWFFLGAVAVVVPLSFYTEWRTRGRFLDQAVLESGSVAQVPLTGFDDIDGFVQFVTRPRVPSAGIVELILWGPRQVMEAVGKLKLARRVKSANRLMAANMLLELCRRDNLSIPEMSPMIETWRAIVYLLLYEWIGLSKDGTRAWASSLTRARPSGVLTS